EPSRLWDLGSNPLAIGAHPVRARPRHDPQTAIAPALPLRSESVRRHDDRNQSGASDRPKAGRGLQERDDRVLAGLSQKIALRSLLLLDQEAEVLVEPRRSRLNNRTQLLLPLLAVARAVDVRARSGDATSPVEALDPRLRTNHILDQREVNPGELAQSRELSGSLEDPLAERSRPQLLGQAIRIPLVALLSPALCNAGHHDLRDVWAERLVEPRTLQPLFEDQMLLAGDHPNRLDQGLAVGLDRKVLQPLAGLRNHGERAARSMHIEPDVPFHRCLLSLGIVESPTRGSPTQPGGTHLRHSRRLRRCAQTPSPYDAYALGRNEHRRRAAAAPARVTLGTQTNGRHRLPVRDGRRGPRCVTAGAPGPAPRLVPDRGA